MASAEEGFRIEKLTAENYHSWKFSMKMYLIGKDLWEIVSGAEKLEAEVDADIKVKFKNVKILLLPLFVWEYRQVYMYTSEAVLHQKVHGMN